MMASIKSTIEKVARFVTPLSATPSLDVAANLEHLRSGDPERVRSGLRFLADLGPAAREARSEIEPLLTHGEPEIAALAARALGSIERG